MCHQHSFINSIQNNISFCQKCGCLSSEGSILRIPTLFETQTQTDPLEILSNCLIKEKNQSISRQYCLEALQIRQKGINHIRLLAKKMQLDKSILFKSILYFDTINLTPIAPAMIINVATICVKMAVQFNDNCDQTQIDSIFNELHYIPFHYLIEIACIKALNYDLGHVSAYDYITMIFSMGITSFFDKDDNSRIIDKLYEMCISFLGEIVENNRYLDFSQSELAFTIIKKQCQKSNIFSLNQFENVYRVNFYQGNLTNCYYILSFIDKTNSSQMKKKNNRNKKNVNNCKLYSIKAGNPKINSNSSCSTVESIDY